MSDTPRTDALLDDPVFKGKRVSQTDVLTEYARQLERELNAAREAIRAYQSEYETSVPDYVLRQRYRKQLFAVLAAPGNSPDNATAQINKEQ